PFPAFRWPAPWAHRAASSSFDQNQPEQVLEAVLKFFQIRFPLNLIESLLQINAQGFDRRAILVGIITRALVEFGRRKQAASRREEKRLGIANLAQFLLQGRQPVAEDRILTDRKSTRLNSSHVKISYAVFCLKKKKQRD